MASQLDLVAILVSLLTISLVLILGGCTTGGLYTNEPADGKIARYCVDGTAQIGGNAPAISGGTQGRLESHGVAWWGTPPPDAITELAKTPCNGLPEMIGEAVSNAVRELMSEPDAQP